MGKPDYPCRGLQESAPFAFCQPFTARESFRQNDTVLEGHWASIERPRGRQKNPRGPEALSVFPRPHPTRAVLKHQRKRGQPTKPSHLGDHSSRVPDHANQSGIHQQYR